MGGKKGKPEQKSIILLDKQDALDGEGGVSVNDKVFTFKMWY
jgi:hypothetical protein